VGCWVGGCWQLTLLLKTFTNDGGILLGTTNKMQRFTIFFIIVNALHVLGGFPAHHQELKNCTHSIWYVPDAVFTVKHKSNVIAIVKMHFWLNMWLLSVC
jgi:hypothetical protein